LDSLLTNWSKVMASTAERHGKEKSALKHEVRTLQKRLATAMVCSPEKRRRKSEIVCMVCKEYPKDSRMGVLTKCGHFICESCHAGCLVLTGKHKNKCPTCRNLGLRSWQPVFT
jgi:hypothetical protein